MIKKIVIAGGFLIGGYYLIKRFLPEFHAKYLELNTKSADDIDPEQMLGTSIGVQGMSHHAMPTLRSIGLNLTLNF